MKHLNVRRQRAEVSGIAVAVVLVIDLVPMALRLGVVEGCTFRDRADIPHDTLKRGNMRSARNSYNITH